MSAELLDNKTCTKCKINKPLFAFSVHRGIKSGLRPSCNECISIESKAYYYANKEKRALSINAWQNKNKEKVRQINSERRKNKPQESRDATSKWVKNNREKVNKYKREYRLKNPAAVAKHEMRRRAAEAQATVAWRDQSIIDAIYKLARIATACTGIKFEVDHEIPLRGKYVSGLHVEHNLTVVTKEHNVKKSNKFTDSHGKAEPDRAPNLPAAVGVR